MRVPEVPRRQALMTARCARPKYEHPGPGRHRSVALVKRASVLRRVPSKRCARAVVIPTAAVPASASDRSAKPPALGVPASTSTRPRILRSATRRRRAPDGSPADSPVFAERRRRGSRSREPGARLPCLRSSRGPPQTSRDKTPLRTARHRAPSERVLLGRHASELPISAGRRETPSYVAS